MKSEPALRIVHPQDCACGRPACRYAATSLEVRRIRIEREPSLLGRMIEASEPGDFDALLIGLILGTLLITGLIISANFDMIASWLRG